MYNYTLCVEKYTLCVKLYIVCNLKLHTCYSFRFRKLNIVARPRSNSHTQKLVHIFLSFHMAIPWICVPIPKSQVICRKQKKTFFLHFLLSLQKFFQVPVNWTILTPADFTIVHLKICVPKFPKTHVEVFDTFKIFSPIPLRSQKIPICVPQKIVFGQFFCC